MIARVMYRKLTTAVFMGFGIAVALFVLHGGHAYAYAQNELVGDSVFLDASSMSQSQIQSFLASKGSYLANYSSLSGRDNANVPAAQVIYEAAQDYGINPQVILSTLQKEQSLITDPSPSASQLNFAMGYGCPDSGSCSYPGFFNQVDNATWQFRFNYERASGNNTWWRSTISYACGSATGYYSTGLYPGRNVTFYDDSHTAYATFTIANATTASFYCYTPHAYNNPQGLYGNPQYGTTGQYYSGSYNFVVAFERWFGNTTGDLVRTLNDATVFLVNGNNKYPISSLDILGEYSSLGPIRFVTDGSLANKVTGSPLTHLVGGPDGTLYFIHSGIRLAFTSCADVSRYGYSCGLVNYLNDGQLRKFFSGPSMTPYYYTTSGKKFYIENATKREIFDDQSLAQAGLGGGANTLLEQGIAYLPYGQPVIRNGGVGISRKDGTHYLYDSGKFYPMDGEIGNFGYIQALPHNYLDQSSFPASNIAPVLNGFVSNTGQTTSYTLTKTGKVALTNPSDWGVGFASLSDGVLAALPTGTEPLNNQLIKSQSDSTVYYVVNGKKRPIPSWTDLVNFKVSPFTINVLSSKTTAAVPTGSRIYAPGRLVKVSSSATVYVARSPTELYTIGSFTFPQELGLSMEILTMNDTELQTYTVVGSLQTQISCGGTNYVGIRGKLYAMSTAKLSQYGLNAADFKDVTSACLTAPVATQPLGDFIRTSDGTIFQVQNGTKQAFTNYGAYVAHGGNGQNTSDVSNYFAGLVPSGANITN